MLLKVRFFSTLILLAMANLACFSEGGISSGWKTAHVMGEGIIPESGILLQEYWLNGHARYFAFNANAAARSLSVRELTFNPATGTSQVGRRLAGPWPMEPWSAIDVDASELEAAVLGGQSLLHFALADGKRIGVLRPPALDSRIRASALPQIVTSLNASSYPASIGLSWFEATTLSVPPNTDFDVTLHVTGDFFALRFGEGSSEGSLDRPPASTLIAASSGDLRVETIAGIVWVYRDGADPNSIHDVSFRWRSPAAHPLGVTRLILSRCLASEHDDCANYEVQEAGMLLQ